MITVTITHHRYPSLQEKCDDATPGLVPMQDDKKKQYAYDSDGNVILVTLHAWGKDVKHCAFVAGLNSIMQSCNLSVFPWTNVRPVVLVYRQVQPLQVHRLPNPNPAPTFICKQAAVTSCSWRAESLLRLECAKLQAARPYKIL